MSNAVKFTDVGGVRLLIRAAEDPADRIGRHLVFEVVDTGPGLEAEVMARLFNSFEQADAGTTRRHGGTGLGLAISRRLAELMEGSLTVESAVGQGSAFRLTIPLVEREPIADEPADEPSAAEPAVSARPLSILIAEDHEVNRRLLRFMLEPLGGDLTMVENGELAVAAAARRPFDAILMDFQMPVMSGLEATRRIRAGEGPNAHCPIIAITANAFDEQRRDWTEAGANAFLTKPIDPPALFAALSNCT